MYCSWPREIVSKRALLSDLLLKRDGTENNDYDVDDDNNCGNNKEDEDV